jgi:hypothetical protein
MDQYHGDVQKAQNSSHLFSTVSQVLAHYFCYFIQYLITYLLTVSQIILYNFLGKKIFPNFNLFQVDYNDYIMQTMLSFFEL